MRIDKALWCFRKFKTRRLAKEACDKSKIKINDIIVKSSAQVGVGDEIIVKKGVAYKSFKIIDFPKSRVGASILFQYIVETTPEDEKNRAEEVRLENNKYPSPKGRPTKKDRRNMKKYMGNDEE